MSKIVTNFRPLYPSVSNIRKLSVSATFNEKHSCKVLVVGGGSGGCTMAAKFVRAYGPKKVIVLEPSDVHYYQPLWTLVAAGIRPLSVTARPEGSVLPAGAKWLKDSAVDIDPKAGVVETKSGDKIKYEFLVVALGIGNDYGAIPGFQEGLDDPDSGVSTIYSPRYCQKTWQDMQRFRGGEAVFTYPDSLIKCPGAPQKIAYLADSYFNKTKVRSKTNISFNTCLPVIFGVKKYADALLQVVKRKNINVNYEHVLIELRPKKKEAVYKIRKEGREVVMPYDMIHVTPSQRPPSVLRCDARLAGDGGYLTVDKHTLQHTAYPNIFGLGDCTDTPNSKTAAAIAKQCLVVERNLLSVASGQKPPLSYDGYGACPLVTSYNTCILAEFIYGGIPRETLPINQAKERILAFYMKRDLFPFLYWNFMLKGHYHGPEFVRRIINPFAE